MECWSFERTDIAVDFVIAIQLRCRLSMMGIAGQVSKTVVLDFELVMMELMILVMADFEVVVAVLRDVFGRSFVVSVEPYMLEQVVPLPRSDYASAKID